MSTHYISVLMQFCKVCHKFVIQKISKAKFAVKKCDTKKLRSLKINLGEHSKTRCLVWFLLSEKLLQHAKSLVFLAYELLFL